MIIICFSAAGMGNQMSQYAFGRYLSIKYNVPLKFDLTLLRDRTPRWYAPNFAFRDFDIEVFNIAGTPADRNEIPVWFRSFFAGKWAFIFLTFRHKFFPNPGREKELSFVFDPRKIEIGPDAYG